MATRIEVLNRLLSIQEQMQAISDKWGAEHPLDYSKGIHLGQVIERQNQLALDMHLITKAIVDICYTIRRVYGVENGRR